MKTTNYNIFKLIKSNRNIQPGLVKRLKESIKKIGYIEARPIIVNKNMEIIDGQNRFFACQELKLPIFYSIIETKISDNILIEELNKNQLIWRLQDFVHHFAEQNVNFHIGIRDFEAHHHLGISNSISICSVAGIKSTTAIRTGKNSPLNKKREAIAEFILSCHDVFFYKSSHFVCAVCQLFEKANEQQITKIKKKRLAIPQQPSVTSYLSVFQNIINKNNPNNKISFT